MKHLIAGVLVLFVCHFTYGQETKFVSKNAGGFKEEFNVLTTNKKVKHGEYKKYAGKETLIIEGTYDNNEKTGEWKFYPKEEPAYTYNFTTKEIKYAKKPDYASKAMLDGTVQEIQLDTPPLYLGSKAELTDALNKVMTYPQQALRMGVEGKVVVSVWITENDALSDIKVLQGFMAECNQEVINGLPKIEKDWIAGTKDGNRLTSQLIIVIEFKLHNNGDKTITVL